MRTYGTYYIGENDKIKVNVQVWLGHNEKGQDFLKYSQYKFKLILSRG